MELLLLLSKYRTQQILMMVDLNFDSKVFSTVFLSNKSLAHAGTSTMFHRLVKYLGSYALPQTWEIL